MIKEEDGKITRDASVVVTDPDIRYDPSFKHL